MSDLIFELGTEELPARFVEPGLEDLERLFREQCKAARVEHGSIRRFGTPRRLALLVEGLSGETSSLTRELTGPPVKAAFDATGQPTIAAKKFAASVNRPVEELDRVTLPKGEYLAATVEEKGQPVAELLPAILTASIVKLPFPKSMRWADVERMFGRPLQWILAVLGEEVVPVVFGDVRSGRETRGHRFLAPQGIPIGSPGEYEAALEKAGVIASIEARGALLAQRLAAAAEAAQAKILPDEELFAQVVNLVELPNPVVGSFEPRHLDLPAEVLIEEMKSHQRYFSLTDAAGRILPRFIAVSNTPARDEALSIRGYERVLRARLTDGRFFFDEDRKHPLRDRLQKLARRNWVQGLGSMADKTERIRALADFLAGKIGQEAWRETVRAAAELCKCDLETGMVGEFPELQGVMGREYAKHDGLPPEVALAIYEHYLPRGANDVLPTQDAGALIGLADRFDSLCGLFAIGKKPTGAKDEYALRRAAIAVINLVLARGYRFSLGEIIDQALTLLEGRLVAANPKYAREQTRQQVIEFIQDRLRPLWKEDARADIIEAVAAAGADDLVGAWKRVQAMSDQVKEPGFPALAATFKRVANIVAKQGGDVARRAVDAGLLQEGAEKALYDAVADLREAVRELVAADQYGEALALIATLQPRVNAFFDEVTVMSPEASLRENRLCLLMEICGMFGQFADFAKLQTEEG